MLKRILDDLRDPAFWAIGSAMLFGFVVGWLF